MFRFIHATHFQVAELFLKHILVACSAHYRFKADPKGIYGDGIY